jgi:hypothetical protein
MTSAKGAIPALRLALPGAPHSWHTVGDIGLFHPDYAVPLGTLGITEDRAKELDKDKGCPVALEQVSKADADEAAQAWRAEAGVAAVVTNAAQRRAATELERERLAEQASAIKGTDAGAKNPDSPKEG